MTLKDHMPHQMKITGSKSVMYKGHREPGTVLCTPQLTGQQIHGKRI